MFKNGFLKDKWRIENGKGGRKQKSEMRAQLFKEVGQYPSPIPPTSPNKQRSLIWRLR